MPKIAIILGSDSDWSVIEPGYVLLQKFNVKTEVLVASAHRTPDTVHKFVSQAKDNNIELIIAAAGMAAHLPGIVAAYTTLPVIGIPISSSTLKGMDALLSIVQMPPGIPVATMSIDGGKNAALYALAILALKDPTIAERLLDFRQEQANLVQQKNQILQAQLNNKGSIS